MIAKFKMNRKKIYLVAGFFIVLFSLYLLALSADIYRMQRQKPMNGTYAIHVFSYEWHSGIVLDYASIPEPYKAYFAL